MVEGNLSKVLDVESAIDEIAARLWSITNTELKAIRSAIADKVAPGRASEQPDREDGDE